MPFLPLPSFIDWVALVSLLGFAGMGADKLLAVAGQRRFSEKMLWLTAFVGGSPGILVGGIVFHHKTSKTGFWVPVAIAATIWFVAFALLPNHPGVLLS